jgi:hydrogenase maturation protease
VAERVLVIGVGNELRGDDGAGIAVARQVGARALKPGVRGLKAGLDVREHQGEPTALLEIWNEAGAVVLIDAVRSGAPPGTIHRLEVGGDPLPARWSGSSSTHAFALVEAIELARSLHRLPAQLVVFGVEGRTFAAGAELSAEVRRALPAVADAVGREAVMLALA